MMYHSNLSIQTQNDLVNGIENEFQTIKRPKGHAPIFDSFAWWGSVQSGRLQLSQSTILIGFALSVILKLGPFLILRDIIISVINTVGIFEKQPRLERVS